MTEIWKLTPLILATLVLTVITIPLFIFSFPGIIGAEDALIVQSGSMEPDIRTGSLIFVYSESPDEIEEGDIITFHSKINGEYVKITHRVVRISRANQSYIYLTKGDALDIIDREWVPEENLIGEVRYTVPNAGHLISLYRENDLLSGLIILLAAGILIKEIRTVVQ